MDIEYIEIVFENIESIVIPISRVAKLDYGKKQLFSEKYELVKGDPFLCQDNVFISDHLSLHVSYGHEHELNYVSFLYKEPLGVYTNNPVSNSVEDRPNILGRLINHNDITCINELDKNKQTIASVYVPWGELEYENTFMKTVVTSHSVKITI